MIMPQLTLIEMNDGSCKIKADSTRHGGSVEYLHVSASQQDMLEAILSYKNGAKIQDCFPFLSAEERDFMLTGMTPEQQDRFYNDVQMGTAPAKQLKDST